MTQDECRKTELLPCPFCGFHAEMIPRDSDTWLVIKCCGCSAQIRVSSIVDGLKWWNSRPTKPVSLEKCAYAAEEAAVKEAKQYRDPSRMHTAVAKAVLDSLKAQGMEIEYD